MKIQLIKQKQLNSKFSEKIKRKINIITRKRFSENIEERVKKLYYKYLEIEALLILKDVKFPF